MAYIGSSPTKVVSRQSANIFTYTVSVANTTVFSGADDNGNTLACSPSDIMVHINGLRMEKSDFSATSTSVTLVSGAAAGDEVTITAFLTFESADHYTKSAADTRYVNASGDTMSGNLTIDTNTFHVDVADNRVGIGTTTPTNNLTIIDGGATPYGADDTVLLDIKRNTVNTGATNAVGFRLANNSNGFNIKYGGASDTLNISGGSGNTVATFRNDGGLTLPYQPAFMVTQTGSNHNQHSVVVDFNTVIENRGSHFSTSTNRFTAPVTGMYHFHVHTFLDQANTRDAEIYLRRNGSVSGFGYEIRNYTADVHSKYGPSLTIQATVTCNASDYVDVYTGIGLHANYGTYFGGYLIG